MSDQEKSDELDLEQVDKVLEALCTPDLTKALKIFVGKRNVESLRKTILDFIVVWNKVHAVEENLITTLLLRESSKSVSSRVFDKNGVELEVGHIVLHHNQSQYTRCEYWDPIYEVVYAAPSFGLKWIGGGKDGGNHLFTLRSRTNELEVVAKSLDEFLETDLGKRTIKK